MLFFLPTSKQLLKYPTGRRQLWGILSAFFLKTQITKEKNKNKTTSARNSKFDATNVKYLITYKKRLETLCRYSHLPDIKITA